MATAGHEVAAPTCRSSGARVAAGLLLALLLTGCSADVPVPAPSPAPASPSPSATRASPSASPSGGTGWNAEGPSFGVDRATWPGTVKEAEPLLQDLPESFEGFAREIARPPGETGELGESGPSTGAQYGDQRSLSIAEAFTTTDTEDGKPTTMSAHDLLAANFLLVMACAEGSYQGTARPAEGGLGPAPGSKPGKEPVWFSCAVEGAEGDEDLTAHVVGWTSGKTAWQVLAPDEASLRSLVTVVHAALG